MEEVVSFTSALQLSLEGSRRVLRELQTNELGGLTQEAVEAIELSIEETLEAPLANGAQGLDVASIDITNIINTNNGVLDVTFTVTLNSSANGTSGKSALVLIHHVICLIAFETQMY